MRICCISFLTYNRTGRIKTKTMRKQDLIKRLSTYYPMEKLHAFFTFPAMTLYFVYTYAFHEIIFLVYGLLVCIFILIQGQHYWKLKLYSLTNRPFDQKRNIHLFQQAKKINMVLIGCIPVVFILQWYQPGWTFRQNNLFAWSVGMNVFAVLEHINYYHVQLMVDNKADLNYILRNKQLKTASLKKDLVEQKI